MTAGARQPTIDIATRVRELRRQGVGAREIARRLGVAQATVHYHLRTQRATRAAALPVPAGPRPVARHQVETRDQVARLIADGLSRAEIARALGLSKSTVSYHARRLGADVDERCARRYDWRAVQAYYDRGNGVRSCIREFGFSSETWYAAVRRGVIAPRPAHMSTDQLFRAGVPRNRGHLKQRLLRDGLKDGRCECCGIGSWRDRPLSLALHHINGVRDDNRLENLQLLCPNCHSQTDTFSGRNGRAPLAVAQSATNPTWS